MFDLIIIGAAAAGCTAAIYAARRNLNFIVITKDIGGEVALSGEVENWPGQIHTTGVALAQDFYKHATSYGVKFENGLAVTAINTEGAHQVVITKDANGAEKKFETKAVIIASGIHPRLLGVPGEEALRGKGVTYCTVCDGPLYKNKITATVGSGNSALESALMMAGIATKVFLISKFPNTPETNGGFPRGENILVDKVKQLSNVEIVYAANTLEITGADFVTGLKYEDTATGAKKELATDGVMVHVGMIPNSDLVDGVTKTPAKEIVVNQICATNRPGIFAAGDVTDIPYKQISIAVGQGATAALAAIDYINRWHE